MLCYSSFINLHSFTSCHSQLISLSSSWQIRIDNCNTANIAPLYTFNIIDPNSIASCVNTTDHVLFRKHCTVGHYLLKNPQIDWVLVLDGDVYVVNATKRIEWYLPVSNPNIHVIHYERSSGGEVAAGNYLIQNHPWSYLYLKKWVEAKKWLPPSPYANADNGVLHLHFLDMVGKLDNITFNRCYQFYNQCTSGRIYMVYVGCVKCALGGRRIFDHVQLLRRFRSFVRDSFFEDEILTSYDFLIHGLKENLTQAYYTELIDTSKCILEPYWQAPVQPQLFTTNLTVYRQLLRRKLNEWMEAWPESVGIEDVSDCWPTCPEELVGDEWKKNSQVLCAIERSRYLLGQKKLSR